MAKAEQDEMEETKVGTLSVKLPAFWPDKPEAWFGLAKANFRARRITSKKSQFNLAVVALDSETINGVLDLLEKPPGDSSYDELKARLIQAFKISTVDKIQRAMEIPPLTDEMPSRLADNIIAMMRGATAEDFAKTIFMLKLPDRVRSTMWAEPLTDWTTMKTRANALWHAEKTKNRARICEASLANACTGTCAHEPEANAVGTARKGRKPSQFQEFARTFQQTPNGPCVFHEFFGVKATRCREPRSRAGNVKAGRQ